MRNRRCPEYNEPAIVVKTLLEPVLSPDSEAGSPYFREIFDVVLGTIDDDGDFLCFYMDSHRFEPWSERGTTDEKVPSKPSA